MADQDREKKFGFTKRRLAALTPPTDGKRAYYLDETEGLTLCVTPSGTKTFYLVRWFQGRAVRVPLGKFPAMSVEDARKACLALLAKMSQGIDVQAARQAARHEQTVKGLWEFWRKGAEQGTGRKRGPVKTLKEDEQRYKRFLATWANRRLSSIKRTDIQSLFAKVSTENGTYAANRLLALVKSMFHRALTWASPVPILPPA